MSRSKHKRFEKKSAGMRQYEAKRAELELDVKTPVLTKKSVSENQVVLSKAQFAKHKKARDIMLRMIGIVSEQLHKGILSDEEAIAKLIFSAKRSIQKTNLKVALRAWEETYHKVMRTGTITVNKQTIPLYWEPLVGFWRTFGFKGHTMTELTAGTPVLACESCGKTKAVKMIKTSHGEQQLCMYCRAKVTKGIEVKKHE